MYWAGADAEVRTVATELRLPVFVNDLARGLVPADHELALRRAGMAFERADLVVVAGTPLDFRLGFGAFADAAVVHLVDSEDGVASHVPSARPVVGDLRAILAGLADWSGPREDHDPWIKTLREQRTRPAVNADGAQLFAASDPIKPTRVIGERAKPARTGRSRDMRRGRLRVLRRQVHRYGPSWLLAGHRSVRLSRQRARLRHWRPADRARPVR